MLQKKDSGEFEMARLLGRGAESGANGKRASISQHQSAQVSAAGENNGIVTLAGVQPRECVENPCHMVSFLVRV